MHKVILSSLINRTERRIPAALTVSLLAPRFLLFILPPFLSFPTLVITPVVLPTTLHIYPLNLPCILFSTSSSLPFFFFLFSLPSLPLPTQAITPACPTPLPYISILVLSISLQNWACTCFLLPLLTPFLPSFPPPLPT